LVEALGHAEEKLPAIARLLTRLRYGEPVFEASFHPCLSRSTEGFHGLFGSITLRDAAPEIGVMSDVSALFLFLKFNSISQPEEVLEILFHSVLRIVFAPRLELGSNLALD
jgi:hypothetical protein